MQVALLFLPIPCFYEFSGVIEVLVNSGRQIDAVNLAHAFELTEKYSPVPLLKSYLKDAKKAASPVKPGNTSPTAQVCSPFAKLVLVGWISSQCAAFS